MCTQPPTSTGCTLFVSFPLTIIIINFIRPCPCNTFIISIYNLMLLSMFLVSVMIVCVFLTLFISLCQCSVSRYNCSSNLDCNVLNFPFPTGVCMNSSNSTTFGTCECIYSCLQSNPITQRCELEPCYNLSLNSNSTDISCTLESGSEDDYLSVLFSTLFFPFGVAHFLRGRWYIAVIQVSFGVWILVSYISNILIYVYLKPYPDTWHAERRFNKYCGICCCQHSLVTILFSIWWLLDLFFFSFNVYSDNQYCS